MAAATTVFDTAELLEAILLQLPLVDILRAQRINRSFQDSIKKSPSLQRALFLKPYSDFTAKLIGCEPLNAKECPLRETCDQSSVTLSSTDDAFKLNWVQSKSGKHCGIVLNPFLPSFNVIGLTRMNDHFGFASPWACDIAASWNNMLLTQPSVENVVISTDFQSSRHWHILRSGDGVAGVTLGQLQRFLEDFRDSPYQLADIVGFHELDVIENPRACARLIAVSSTAAEVMAEIEVAVKVEQEETEEIESD
ncbi:hypothetical protein CKM354_001153600 [Cercospora kikuchii]|uniref:F-box domain-containing protein n=1 Tax=Cercospora kikuchii TaxID=84275 RepID=A0A9P3CSF9_9PEZI|nr:uncharacterized protein CKM354_001153600 [Cercospora kikuchii]GIZ48477.1 hypothetical protein CKM354_001153600 [Cercospora kikuchii]